jgi:hypothetical protein
VKLNIHLKFLYLFIGIIFISIMYSTKAISIDNVAKPPKCTVSATGVVTITTNTGCTFQPDEQKVTFYQVDFCKAVPTAPTLTSNMIKNNCSTFFKNESGAEINIEYQNGTGIGTESDYSAMPYGTYTHAIITMGTVFKYKSTVTFASANVNDSAAGKSSASQGETKCATKVSTPAIKWGFANFSGSNDEDFVKGTIDCGSDLTAQEISVGINTIGGMDGNNCKTSGRFEGTDTNVDVFLIDASGNLVNGTSGGTGCVENGKGTGDRIIGVMPLSLKIDRNTSGFRVKYNNKNGIYINFGSDSDSPFWITDLDSAYIDMTITAVQKRTRRPRTGAWR